MKRNWTNLFIYLMITTSLLSVFCAQSGIQYENPTVDNVVKAFNQLDTTGKKMAVWTNEVIPYPFYSVNQEHDFGDNHFQGIQRLRNKNYLVISGSNIADQGDLSDIDLPGPGEWGDMKPPGGNLYIARITSKSSTGSLATNVDKNSERPPEQDKLVLDIEINSRLECGTYLWHPGGLSVVGDILIVPVENYHERLGAIVSEILFYNVMDPAHPVLFDFKIDRTKWEQRNKAGAVAMVRLTDKRFLLATRTTSHLYFYLSKTTRFEDGFQSTMTVFDENNTTSANGLKKTKFAGSSMNFIKQKDGQLFLISFDFNHAEGEDQNPEQPGRHTAYLFKVDFPDNEYFSKPVITKVAEKIFGDPALNPKEWGHFSAAAGLYIHDDGLLAVYTTPFWQVAHVGDVSLQNYKEKRFFTKNDNGIIPIIEYWSE